ncbi:uncharacterized protein METZ01_LOCUS166262, partial [marine metagenome]
VRFTFFSFIFALLGLSALADTLLKQDGNRLEGSVELQASGKLKIGDVIVSPEDVQLVEFDHPPVVVSTNEIERLAVGLMAVENPGALSLKGTYIARPVIALNDTKVSFEGGPKDIFLSTHNASAIFFGPISLGQAEDLRSRKPGVLLRSGDYVEG